MDSCDNSNSLWDSSHDWILQFDNILKHRPNYNLRLLTNDCDTRNKTQIKQKEKTMYESCCPNYSYEYQRE